MTLWDGVQMDIIKAGEEVVRCAVLCTACDISAGQKMCGFLGHSAMHTLFLGSGKHMLKSAWLTVGFISGSPFDLIQERVNSVVVLAGIGRIPHKIKSGFASFTADQWKNWIVYYATLVFFDILPQNHLECW